MCSWSHNMQNAWKQEAFIVVSGPAEENLRGVLLKVYIASNSITYQ
jgi:hypothetical protein